MKISQASQDQLIKIGGLFIGGFVAFKLITNLGTNAVKTVVNAGEGHTEASQQANTTAANNYIKDTLAQQAPTKSEGEWAQIVDTIYNDLNYYYIGNATWKDAVYQLSRAKNEADVAMLVKQWGRRTIHRFGLPYANDVMLMAAVRAVLPNDYIATINSNYAYKGIKFRF